MFFEKTETEKIIEIIERGARTQMSSIDIVKQEISNWLINPKRKLMLTGEQYYLNHTDIQNKKRTLTNGVELQHRANNQLEHGFYRKLADQKLGYLLSKLPSVTSKNDTYAEELESIFNRSFWRSLKTTGREAINKGIAWLQVYFKDEETIAFKLIPSEQIIPFWLDNAHTEINELLRIYDVEVYNGKKKEIIRKVEHWSIGGVKYYEYANGELVDDVNVSDENGNEINYHLLLDGKPYNWDRLPFIPFRYNDLEQPLIDTIKSLIDNYNMQASVNADLLEDIPKFIYKLTGYGGQNLEEFINDLQQYLAIKLQPGGDVDKLQAEPNTEATGNMLKQGRKDILEFGKGVDTQSDDLGNSSGVALKFRYSDLDNDCNILETEFQYSLELLLWFVVKYLKITGKGDFTNETAEIIFNRDIIINESEVITDCKNSVGILPDVQIRNNHPWSDKDTERLWKEQQQEEEKAFDNSIFPQQQGGVNNAEPTES